MSAMNPYRTLRQSASDEFIINKSRFIGYAAPCETEAEALAFLQSIRTKHKDATHNCYAYIIGQNAGIMRYSDDGEPGGTAGLPMMEVLKHQGVVNCCCVVTRYFGGILLGAGGLVRAYSHGAKIAVDAASRKLMTTCVLLEMQMDYSFYGKVNYLLPNYVCRVEDTDFGAVVSMKVLFKKDESERFIKEVTELSAALIVPQVVEERFDHFAG